VWRAGVARRVLESGLTGHDLDERHAACRADGLKLAAIAVSEEPEGPRWAGVWTDGADGAEALTRGLRWPDFLDTWRERTTGGMRLTALTTHREQDTVRFTGAWRNGAGAHYLWANASWADFMQKWHELADTGLRLVALTTYRDAGLRRWAGVWQAGQDPYHLWANASWADFLQKWRELAAADLRLVAITTYSDGGQWLWAGAWRGGQDAYHLWADVSWADFRHTDDDLRVLGLVPVALASRPAAPREGAQEGVGLVSLHVRILVEPDVGVDAMIANTITVYAAVGIIVRIASHQVLDLPDLEDIDAGACVAGGLTGEQEELFSHRDGVGGREIVAYFVRSTLPPYNGCAAHPDGSPAFLVTQVGSEWTLAHELGHVLGLAHVADRDRLMTGLGTAGITDPPPDLVPDEVATLAASEFVTAAAGRGTR